MRPSRLAACLALLLASACATNKAAPVRSSAVPEGDPCHLPYLDGKDHFVAAVDLFRASGPTSLRRWSRGGKKASVVVKAPADGFPGGGKLRAVLLLSGHRPIEWKIDPILAKQTDAILLVGYNIQRVTGIPDSMPVAHASYERQLIGKPSCQAMTPGFAKNADASRFFTLNSVMDTMTALGVDRYYQARSASEVTIPSRMHPHQVEK